MHVYSWRALQPQHHTHCNWPAATGRTERARPNHTAAVCGKRHPCRTRKRWGWRTFGAPRFLLDYCNRPCTRDAEHFQRCRIPFAMPPDLTALQPKVPSLPRPPRRSPRRAEPPRVESAQRRSQQPPRAEVETQARVGRPSPRNSPKQRRLRPALHVDKRVQDRALAVNAAPHPNLQHTGLSPWADRGQV